MPTKRSHSAVDSRDTSLAASRTPAASHISKYSRADTPTSDTDEKDIASEASDETSNIDENNASLLTSKLAYRGPRPHAVGEDLRPAHTVSRDSATTSGNAARTTARIHCSLPPHPLFTFRDVASFERHYVHAHAHKCAACGANFPAAPLLEVHLSDRHDPLMAAQRERGEKTFRCFELSCTKLCRDPARRRLHLVDKHRYPRDFDFRIVVHGLKPGQTSLLRQHQRPDGPGAGRAHAHAHLKAHKSTKGADHTVSDGRNGSGTTARGAGRGQRKGFLRIDRQQAREALRASSEAERNRRTVVNYSSESGDGEESDEQSESEEGSREASSDEEEEEEDEEREDTVEAESSLPNPSSSTSQEDRSDNSLNPPQPARPAQPHRQNLLPKRATGTLSRGDSTISTTTATPTITAVKKMTSELTTTTTDLDDLAQHMGALQFIPRSVVRRSGRHT